MTNDNQCRTVAVCRACSSEFFPESLNLGFTPVANELYTNFQSAISAERFPLIVRMCSNCRHVQLNHTVSAQRLFDSYVYSSSTSETFRQHFIDLASEIAKFCEVESKIIEECKIVEIGSNDGFLIKQLANRGFLSLGIEPSNLLVEKSKALGVNVLQGYLTEEIVDRVLSNFGAVNFVVGNNVFAHIDEISDALLNVNALLDMNGVFIMEVAYLRDLYERNLFDSIYHEHISYHSIYSLNLMLNQAGFRIINVERINTHGGSIRVWAKKNHKTKEDEIDSVDALKLLIDEEVKIGLTSPGLLRNLELQIGDTKSKIEAFVDELDPDSFNFGYTAPAKIMTFLSQIDLDKLHLQCIVDDNPSKQGLFIAGHGLEIVSIEEMAYRFEKFAELYGDDASAACLIFAWNLADEIAKRIEKVLTKQSKIITFVEGAKELRWN